MESVCERFKNCQRVRLTDLGADSEEKHEPANRHRHWTGASSERLTPIGRLDRRAYLVAVGVNKGCGGTAVEARGGVPSF
jgi:hypothetical protein